MAGDILLSEPIQSFLVCHAINIRIINMEAHTSAVFIKMPTKEPVCRISPLIRCMKPLSGIIPIYYTNTYKNFHLLNSGTINSLDNIYNEEVMLDVSEIYE